MAQWTILFFSLYGLLHGQEIRPPTVQECCHDGRDRALEGQDCTILPLISAFHSCRIAQEQCCEATVADRLCDNGIKMGKEQGACERPFFPGEPWETKISKVCCDCCMLGLMMPSHHLSCGALQGLLLGRQCAHTAKSCCSDIAEETTPTVHAPVTEKPEVSATTKPPEGSDSCREANCSQLCVGNGTCVCLGGYQLQKDGVNCEDINECLTGRHNCITGQVCTNTEGSFLCQRETSCGTGYELKNYICQDINECLTGRHNCIIGQVCTNTEGSFLCQKETSCGFGYEYINDICQDINECLTGRHNCIIGQVCTNTEGSFLCQRETSCGTGYELKNNICQDVNECLTGRHNCVFGQVCTNTEGSFLCQRETSCGTGYEFKNDICQDVNECLTGRHNCVFGQVCINTEGSFRCQRETSCGTGYELKNDNSCQDINECALGIHNCGPDFLCTNTEGSFRCHPKERCSDGFIQDAVGSCIDVNECVAYTNPCQYGQTCINTVGSYTCRRNTVTCGRGYHLSEDGMRCQDVDECRTGNMCGNHGCVNLVGSYRCECRVGFIFSSVTKLCEDINECRYYPGKLCGHKCENTEGSYQCGCTTGFKLSHDGRNCEDVNECEANPCSQECANVYGSYQCYCRRGYQLSDIDGITCEDIDECALPTGGHVCSYHCSNAPGSFYCTCPPTGYTLSHNGRTCQDIDECAAGIHTCSVSESCFNVQGGFRCLSFVCPTNFRQASQGRCDRVTCEFTRDPASCFLLPLRISFYNISFPTNTAVPTDVFRMGPANSVPGDKILLDIVSGDEEGYFAVQQHAHGGEISLRRTVSQPRDFFLTVEMRLIRYGTAHLYRANIAVFVTNEQPIWPSKPFPY